MFLKCVMTKKELGQVLGYKPGKWTMVLAALEPELLIISPGYKKLSSLLTPKEVRFIIDELTGLSELEFNALVREKREQNTGL